MEHNIEIAFGIRIGDAAELLIQTQKNLGGRVCAKFNDIEIYATIGDSKESICRRYDAEMTERVRIAQANKDIREAHEVTMRRYTYRINCMYDILDLIKDARSVDEVEFAIHRAIDNESQDKEKHHEAIENGRVLTGI